MQNIIDSVNKLVNELVEIEKQLEKLDKEIENQSNPEIEKLNNLIHQTTHEIATEIGFNRIKILYSARFITIKDKYKNFSFEELEEIIDNQNINPSLKLKIFKDKSKEDKKYILEKIKQLKKSWNIEFDNKSFKEVKANYLDIIYN